MNLSPDPLDRALADLASQTDLHQPADRVPAIHRRARRAATVREAGALATVAIVAVVAVSLGAGGLPFVRGEDSVPADPRPAPFLKVSLAYDAKLSAAIPPSLPDIPVVIRITLHGRVPQMANAAGALATSGTDNTLGFKMHWDSNGYDGATPQYGCVAGARLIDVDTDFLMTGYFKRPGTYTIVYDTAACAPVGPVAETLTFTVR